MLKPDGLYLVVSGPKSACRVVSCRVVSCRVVSCRVVSCHVVSCRVVSCCVALRCVALRWLTTIKRHSPHTRAHVSGTWSDVVGRAAVKGEPDWMLEVFHKCGLWDMDNAVHSPVQVPLDTGAGARRADQPADVGPNKKEYFITCSFWTLKKKPSSS